MLINPNELSDQSEILEDIEKASLRLVTQAIYDYRERAQQIFQAEQDLVADIGEDLTREALDKLGVSKIDERLFGKMDYKRARYIFHPDYAVRQALFVDSKAEKSSGRDTATLQTAQTSLIIKHVRQGQAVSVPGTLPVVKAIANAYYLTTTIFVKYNYAVDDGVKALEDIVVAALPNGMLQAVYNPTPQDTIWRAGRNAPSRGEAFRMRLVFSKLKAKCNWRVQTIPLPGRPFTWDD